MSLRKWLSIIGMAAALSLSACGGGDDNKKDEKDKEKTEEKEEDNAAKEEKKEKSVIAGAPFQDGSYSLEEQDFDENGWKVRYTLTVNNGKITEANYNYINAEGQLKSESDDYQKAMSDKTGVGPKDYIPDLNGQLQDKQDPKQVDVISGATHSSEKFINYSQQLVQKVQSGDITPIDIHNGSELKDGEYSLIEKNLDNNGWKTYIKMTVEGGRISSVDYNNTNAEGDLKTNDEGYQKSMSDKTGIGPKEYVPRLSDALVEHQNTEAIDIIAGATHSSHIFKLYAAQLINAAQKGDTTPIEVDNLVYEK